MRSRSARPRSGSCSESVATGNRHEALLRHQMLQLRMSHENRPVLSVLRIGGCGLQEQLQMLRSAFHLRVHCTDMSAVRLLDMQVTFLGIGTRRCVLPHPVYTAETRYMSRRRRGRPRSASECRSAGVRPPRVRHRKKVNGMAMKEKHVETKKEREEKRREKKEARERRHEARSTAGSA